jgi:hypothetical protein
MNKMLFVLMIMTTIIAIGAFIPSLTLHLFNSVMAQGNMTKENTTAGNMAGDENITSTISIGSNACNVICD